MANHNTSLNPEEQLLVVALLDESDQLRKRASQLTHEVIANKMEVSTSVIKRIARLNKAGEYDGYKEST